MKFARIVFLVAGVYGLVVITLSFFLEGRFSRELTTPITHPEFYYGFLTLAFAWQVLFLIVARDPARYRVMMIPSMLEKFGYIAVACVLLAQRRLPMQLLPTASADTILGILFVMAYLRTKSGAPTG